MITKMLPIKRRKSESSQRSKRQITLLLKQDPFDPQVDFTDLTTITSLAEIDSQNALIQIECAKSLAITDFAQAKKYFEKAIQLEPNNPEFYYAFAEEIRRSGKRGGYQMFYDRAFELEPRNPCYILGQIFKFNDWSAQGRQMRDALTEAALKIDPNHALAHYHFAHHNRTRWYDGLLPYSSQVQKIFPNAKIALTCNTLTDQQRANMHDIVGCVYAKERRFRSALHHLDQALLCDPNQGCRNYWKFLKRSKIEPELLEVVKGSLAKNFELKGGKTVADLFRMYSILTPGFRALLKKNSCSTYLFLKEFANRERQWMLMIYPFNSDFFPKTVTMEILDFLFSI